MTTYLYGTYSDFEKLVIDIKSKQGGDIHHSFVKFDDNALVTPENAAAWAQYLHTTIEELVTKEAMESEEFQKIVRSIAEQKRRHDEWIAGEPERKRREQHKKELRRTPSLGYIPDGLQVDYAKEYGFYIDSAIEWTPEDNDDFLYQIRSFERMSTKCVVRCIEQGRPDAAYAQAAELLRSLPKWRQREELAEFFDRYKSRLRKLVKIVCQAMQDSATAWNNQEKLIEGNALIEGLQSEFIAWGVKPKAMLDLLREPNIEGYPIAIERKPNKQEQYELYLAEQRRKAEEKRKAEEEAERKSLIPLNQYLEKTVFTRDNVDWECTTIGREIYSMDREVKKNIDRGQSHEALLLFLQIVKSMCRHFISDEHWGMFDDVYDPDYSCMRMVDTLNNAYRSGKFTQADLDFFHEAWKEIEQMEAVWNYGMANYKFEF